MWWDFSHFSDLLRFGWFDHTSANFLVFDAPAPDEEIGGPTLVRAVIGPAFGPERLRGLAPSRVLLLD